ncbi:hypothetical protein P7K49_022935, partial [Saguinus oedipus]
MSGLLIRLITEMKTRTGLASSQYSRDPSPFLQVPAPPTFLQPSQDGAPWLSKEHR